MAAAAQTRLLVVVLVVTGLDAGEWTKFGRYQYLINNNRMLWDDGLAFCTHQKSTAYLARPTTENAEFLKSFGSDKMCLADHRYRKTKGWVWSDGSALPAKDIVWKTGYPKFVSDGSIGVYERQSAELMNDEPNFRKFAVVCQAPQDPTPQPTTTVQPTTTKPDPTTTKPDPTTTKPDPTTTKPDPTTMKPDPTTTKPDPTTMKPDPTTTKPDPTTTKPDPTTMKPDPTTMKPDPTTTKPDPTTTKPVPPFTTDPTITSARTTPVPDACPSGAGWSAATEDGRCFYLSAEDSSASKLSWKDAFQVCDGMGAGLASVPDPVTFYTLSFFVSSADSGDTWTGLLNITGPGLTWSDGSQFNSDLQQFIKGENGTFGYLSSEDGNFHLDDGASPRSFICSIDNRRPTPSTGPTPTAPPCPDGWQRSNDTCYLFAREHCSWTAASHRCYQLGASMVSIHEQALITFLLVNGGDGVYWTGLQNQNDTYVWQDESQPNIALLKPYLDPWHPGKDCVTMDRSLYPQFLVHENCFTEQGFVCQKDANV